MNGWNQNTQLTNHAELMKYVRRIPADGLRFVANDCREAMEANPQNVKNGYYADMISYIGMRIRNENI